MSDLVTAIGLVLVIEGLLYAAFPVAMKRLVVAIIDTPRGALRFGGLAAAVLGVLIVWIGRGS